MESQTDKLYSILCDGKAHRTDELLKLIYGNEHCGIARLGARKFDVEQKYGVEIDGWTDENVKSLYWYQLKVKKDWRKELVRTCVKQGCKTADEILKHITCRTGIIFESPQEIDNERAEWLLRDFRIDRPCKPI